MAYLTVGFVMVALLGLGNLALTLALARRLRTTSAPVTEPLRPGERVAPFVATTTAGVRLTHESLFPDGALVAFLSPSCGPCQEQRPRVHRRAVDLADPRRMVAVVVDDGEEPAAVEAEVAAFQSVATVVVARTGDGLTSAFRVDAYPTLFLVGPDGRIRAAGHDVDRLPDLVA